MGNQRFFTNMACPPPTRESWMEVPSPPFPLSANSAEAKPFCPHCMESTSVLQAARRPSKPLQWHHKSEGATGQHPTRHSLMYGMRNEAWNHGKTPLMQPYSNAIVAQTKIIPYPPRAVTSAWPDRHQVHIRNCWKGTKLCHLQTNERITGVRTTGHIEAVQTIIKTPLIRKSTKAAPNQASLEVRKEASNRGDFPHMQPPSTATVTLVWQHPPISVTFA